MDTHDKRLSDYLDKVAQQHRWDQGQMRDPNLGLFAERPDLTKDETRAHAMGRLSEFEKAAAETRERLVDADIASVARVSLDAADSYRRDVRQQQGLALGRSCDETRFRHDRVMRRWDKQEAERSEDRADEVKGRLLDERFPPHEGNEDRDPEPHESGFAAHARRESALDEARRFVAVQRDKSDPSPGIG